MWRPLLTDLLASGSFSTQSELVRALAERGHEVTQATVSRELANLGARREDGVWRLPPDPRIGAPILRFAITANGCLAVIHTEPAFAAVIAQAVDDAAIDGVLGTIAGEDTVFVATADRRAADRLKQWLGPGRRAGGRP